MARSTTLLRFMELVGPPRRIFDVAGGGRPKASSMPTEGSGFSAGETMAGFGLRQGLVSTQPEKASGMSDKNSQPLTPSP
ncbi:MAG: hypothetical protein MUF23_14265 [Pirellula sp.]|nr:hypothetical protein [Pirellula sp.]